MMKFNFKKWLITKLAGDTLVILNATMIYKYHPIFADISNNPILENNTVVLSDTHTPFQIYDSNLFEIINNELVLKPEYKTVYESVINAIIEGSDKAEPMETTNDKS